MQTHLKEYRLIRWGVLLVVVLGLGLSLLLNVLNAPAQGGVPAQIIAGWMPVAVLLCLELITRIPVRSRFAAVIRILSASGVSAFAGWVSYEHQYEFILRLGFEGNTASFMPATIDGVLVVASVSLVEVSRLVREAKIAIEVAAQAAATPAVTPVQAPPATTERHQGKRGRRPGPQTAPGARRAAPRTSQNVPPVRRDVAKPKIEPVVAPDAEPAPQVETAAEV